MEETNDQVNRKQCMQVVKFGMRRCYLNPGCESSSPGCQYILRFGDTNLNLHMPRAGILGGENSDLKAYTI